MNKIMIILIILMAIILSISFSQTDEIEAKRRKTARNIKKYTRKAFVRLLKAVLVHPFTYTLNYIYNSRVLDSHGWYKSLSGNWTDSHAMYSLTPKDICTVDRDTFIKIYF